MAYSFLKRAKLWARNLKSLLRGSETARALVALGFAVICGGAAFALWAGAGRPNPIKILEADNVTAWLTAIHGKVALSEGRVR